MITPGATHPKLTKFAKFIGDGEIDKARGLLEQHPDLAWSQTVATSAFAVAVESDDYELIARLIEIGGSNIWTIFDRRVAQCVRSGRVAALLHEAGFNLAQFSFDLVFRCLYDIGRTSLLTTLVSQGIRIDAMSGSTGCTALCAIAETVQPSRFRAIYERLEKDGLVDARSNRGQERQALLRFLSSTDGNDEDLGWALSKGFCLDGRIYLDGSAKRCDLAHLMQSAQNTALIESLDRRGLLRKPSSSELAFLKGDRSVLTDPLIEYLYRSGCEDHEPITSNDILLYYVRDAGTLRKMIAMRESCSPDDDSTIGRAAMKAMIKASCENPNVRGCGTHAMLSLARMSADPQEHESEICAALDVKISYGTEDVDKLFSAINSFRSNNPDLNQEIFTRLLVSRSAKAEENGPQATFELFSRTLEACLAEGYPAPLATALDGFACPQVRALLDSCRLRTVCAQSAEATPLSSMRRAQSRGL